MRISGNYLDRLLIKILPLVVLVTTIIHFVTQEDLKQTILVSLIVCASIWLTDSLVIFFKFKKPKSLRLGQTLLWGGTELSSKDILTIKPLTDQRGHWEYNMIEFGLADGTIFFVIDKPNHIIAYFLDKPSRTISQLIANFPDLKTKVVDRHFI